MNQDTARTLFEHGAFLILQDVPEGTDFGIDWNSWVTGPKFEGVKMIPPGVHFVFYNTVSKYGGQPAPRTGFFHNFKSKEIMVKRWSPQTEELLDQHCIEDELTAIRGKLQDLDKHLAAYPYDTLKKWVSMTNELTADVTEKLQPDDRKIRSVLELLPHESTPDDMDTGRTRPTDKDGLPCLNVNPTTVIHFSPIPEQWYPPGAKPSEMTQHSMDSSYVLSTLLARYEKPENILGELQFTFVCFILGQVFDAFEQWKKLVRVICFCECDLNNHIDLFKSFVTVLYHQINEIPVDFFVDIVSSNNFLVSTLSRMFNNIEASCFDEELQAKATKFRKYLTKKYKWKFNAEPEDWAPVVVEL
uniref:Protein AAR2 homolog n=1 Tax=Phallusia mammillata TaxID=59560 RepID=A0A6F9D620_9ASCI|nr:protein AAR2 homolog [Phallusia mammillata]